VRAGGKPAIVRPEFKNTEAARYYPKTKKPGGDMSRPINRNFFVFAAASALAACAATPPASTGVSAAQSASKPAAIAAGDKRATKGYRQVTKNGVEYFCRRESITGSRTVVADTCLTKAQMDSIADNSQDLVHRLNNVPGTMPGADSSGGASNSVMGR
jgi:hypothetical protein